MHIKQVVLSGFRSFRHQSETEPFSPKHNVIIGRNGVWLAGWLAALQSVAWWPGRPIGGRGGRKGPALTHETPPRT